MRGGAFKKVDTRKRKIIFPLRVRFSNLPRTTAVWDISNRKSVEFSAEAAGMDAQAAYAADLEKLWREHNEEADKQGDRTVVHGEYLEVTAIRGVTERRMSARTDASVAYAPMVFVIIPECRPACGRAQGRC